jgi:hypothetical protein
VVLQGHPQTARRHRPMHPAAEAVCAAAREIKMVAEVLVACLAELAVGCLLAVEKTLEQAALVGKIEQAARA